MWRVNPNTRNIQHTIITTPSRKQIRLMNSTRPSDEELLSASLKSLNLSLPSPAFVAQNTMRPFHSPSNPLLLQQFTKDLTCCDEDFADLHSLIKHLETCHPNQDIEDGIIEASIYKQPPSPTAVDLPLFPSSPRVTVNLNDIYSPGLFDIEEVNESEETMSNYSEDSLSDMSHLPDISLKRRHNKNRKSSHKKMKLEVMEEEEEEELEEEGEAESDDTDDDQETEPTPTTASTNMTMQQMYMFDPLNPLPNYITPPPTPKPMSMAPKKNKHAHLSVICPITGERKYMCAVSHCKKTYKNANGLKYHMAHAHSDGVGVPEEWIVEQKKKNCETVRPYACTVVGCTKRYKNLNGLKVS